MYQSRIKALESSIIKSRNALKFKYVCARAKCLLVINIGNQLHEQGGDFQTSLKQIGY